MTMDKKFKGTYFISSISLTTSITEFGISSIFTLFLLYVLHFSMDLTSHTYSYYYGFAYALPILIGYISDKYLNKSTALTIGFISMILSQFILSFSSSLYQPSNIVYNNYFFSLQNITFATGLFFLALGTSFTTLSITHIIYSINEENSVINAFSIYYPILNLGVLIGIIMISVIIGDENYHLYEVAFLLFGNILIAGLIAFHLLKNKYLVDNEGELMKEGHSKDSIRIESDSLLHKLSSKSISEIKGLNFKERFNLFNISLSPVEKDRLIVFLIFLVIIIFYRIAYSQSSTAGVFFIDSFVNRDLNTFTVPVQLFFVLNPLFILILSPIFIKINQILENKNIEFDFIKRTTLAMLVISLCFAMLTVLGFYLDIDVMDEINMIWIIIFELLIAISELLFAIAGYSIVKDLTPQKYYSLFFGLFIATRSISMYLSGKLSVLFPESENITFIHNIPTNGLMQYFLMIFFLSLIGAMILFAFRKKLRRKMHLEEITS